MSIGYRFFLILFFIGLGQEGSSQDRMRYRRGARVFDVKTGFMLGGHRSWLAGDDFIVRSDGSGVDYEEYTPFKGKYSFKLGAYLDFKFSKVDFLQIDFRYTKFGWRQTGSYRFSPFTENTEFSSITDMVEVVSSLDYLETVIRYKHQVAPRFFGLVGPFFSVKLLENYIVTNDFGVVFPVSENTPSHYDHTNWGMNIGIIYQLKSGVNFGLEYQHGFKDLNKYQDISSVLVPKNHFVSTSLSLGYTISYFRRFTNYKRRRKGLL